MIKVKIRLKNPLGKRVKIDHGFYRIPCVFFYDQYKLDQLERYLTLQGIEYVIEELPKKVKVLELKESIKVEDKVEIKKEVKEEIKVEEKPKEETKKPRKTRRGRRPRKKETSK